MAEHNEQFPAFVAAVSQRLDAGRQAYGDRSFSAEPAQLLSELDPCCNCSRNPLFTHNGRNVCRGCSAAYLSALAHGRSR